MLSLLLKYVSTVSRSVTKVSVILQFHNRGVLSPSADGVVQEDEVELETEELYAEDCGESDGFAWFVGQGRRFNLGRRATFDAI